MAYPNPTIRVRENNRFIDRGFFYDSTLGRHRYQATNTEVLTAKIDYTDILDGSTITVALASDGLSATPSIAGGVVTLTITPGCGSGDLDITTTFSDGRKRQDFIRIDDPSCIARDDYGLVRVQG